MSLVDTLPLTDLALAVEESLTVERLCEAHPGDCENAASYWWIHIGGCCAIPTCDQHLAVGRGRAMRWQGILRCPRHRELWPVRWEPIR